MWYQEVAEQWGLQFMPTFMLFKHGKKVYTLICSMSSMLNACDYRRPMFADRFIRFSTICLYQRVTDGQNWYCTLPSCCARLIGQKGQTLWWLEETACVAVSAVAAIPRRLPTTTSTKALAARVSQVETGSGCWLPPLYYNVDENKIADVFYW